MYFILDTLTTILKNFESREVPSGSNSVHLPNISTHRNPRAAARSRSARLHAAKSAARFPKHRSTANGVSDSKRQKTSTTGTGAAHGAQPQGTQYRRSTRRLAGGKPLQRCNTAIVPQPVHPQPPGAFIMQPSFVVPGHPELDDRNIPAPVALKLFSDAKVKGDKALLRASEERKERAMDPEYARRLEEAHAACRRVMEEVQARLHEASLRRAEAERIRAMQEEARCEAIENLRKYCEARRRDVEQERQRQAELEATERARREHERLERHRHEQERLKQQRREQERIQQERREHEAVQSNPATQIRHYEDRWARLRSNTAGAEQLKINDIPWPWFNTHNVQCVEDITDELVMEFVGHSLQRHVQDPNGGRVKAARFEMLRWHPDRFDGKVLTQVVEEHREIVKSAAGRIIRILTMSVEKTREL